MNRVRLGPVRIVAPPGVYTPRIDTALLASELGAVRGAAVLELCAGSGALALTAAHHGAEPVVAVDCSARAVLTIRANARRNALRVDARRGDLLYALDPAERFDLILANPPYLPVDSPRSRPDDRWDAGPDGRAVLDRIIEGAGGHLRPGGRLVIVQSTLADVHATGDRLAARGLQVVRRVEHRGPLGPLAAARREHLERSGALAPGDADEVLVVLTAQRVTDCVDILAA